jgi:hypothetical protein
MGRYRRRRPRGLLRGGRRLKHARPGVAFPKVAAVTRTPQWPKVGLSHAARRVTVPLVSMIRVGRTTNREPFGAHRCALGDAPTITYCLRLRNPDLAGDLLGDLAADHVSWMWGPSPCGGSPAAGPGTSWCGSAAGASCRRCGTTPSVASGRRTESGGGDRGGGAGRRGHRCRGRTGTAVFDRPVDPVRGGLTASPAAASRSPEATVECGAKETAGRRFSTVVTSPYLRGWHSTGAHPLWVQRFKVAGCRHMLTLPRSASSGRGG